ncbi:MAG: histidine phosphatase family protein [Bacillota bacterium]|nr:histidine phosphatase family protein [Bacillota bacterium]
MKSKIILIRHGITTGNVQQLYYGGTDVPLAEKGINELKRLAGEGIYPYSEEARFYTTGMTRTEQTLKLIYGDREHEVIEDLRELNFGIFEMKHYSEVEGTPEYEAWINATDESIPPPEGESIMNFKKRIRRGFKNLMVKHELDVLRLRNHEEEAMSICICHGGVISGILNDIWPDRYEYFYSWIPDPGHGYILTLDDAKIVDDERF